MIKLLAIFHIVVSGLGLLAALSLVLLATLMSIDDNLFDIVHRRDVPRATNFGSGSVNDYGALAGLAEPVLTGATCVGDIDFAQQAMFHQQLVELLAHFWAPFVTTVIPITRDGSANQNVRIKLRHLILLKSLAYSNWAQL